MSARPLAVFVGGPPATGKSTLAAALAPALHAALLDLDTATGPLTALVLDLIGEADPSAPRAAELTRGRRYEALLGLAEDTTRAGTSAVLVAPFRAEAEAARWDGVARRLAPVADAHLIWLEVRPAELARRLVARGAGRDAGKLADPDAFARAAAGRTPTAPHLALDATRPVAELVAAVLSHLGR